MVLRSLDLFSGVGGITHALRGLATPAMYCEVDTECHVVMKKLMARGKLPRAPIHPDVTKLFPKDINGKVDMIVAGFPCFPAGTLVNTDAGYVPIEAVTHDRLLLTHTGSLKPINNLQRTLLPAGQPMYTIAIRGAPRPIRCTEEHPFYARRAVDGGFGAPEFVAAKCLTTEHVVGMPLPPASREPEKARVVLDGQATLETELTLQRVRAALGDPLGGFIDGGHVWRRVEAVKATPTTADQWVYNFEVADDNSYCVENMAVHNCIGFSSSGNREGLDQPGSALFREVMRLANALKPPLMFFENVDAILSNADITTIVDAIRRLDYDMYWVVMPAYTVGAPQKRGRWFCLCVRRGAPSITIAPSEAYTRFSWKTSEPTVRMVPAATPDVRRRMRMLGNSVVPDCVRAAFLSLFTGCTRPVPDLLRKSTKGGPKLTLTPPVPQGPATGDHKKYACVVGKLGVQRIPRPPGLLGPPALKLVLDPKAYRATAPPSKDLTSGLIKKPKPISMWSTIRAGNGAYAMNYLTNRGSHDLASQIRFEKGTPSSQRGGVTNPEFGEWLMGYPRGWTSS